MSKNIDEPEIYESESQNHLWSVQLKATPGRIALLDLLRHEKKPVSVVALVKCLKKSGAKLTSPSIYRALESLVEAGLVDRVDTSSEHAVYEIHVGRAHHHHITCGACGDIEDVRKCLPKNIESTILADSAKFDRISRHSLEFFGTCKKCART
ncbi:MAG: transcriptional repressor [Candidatus Pacebacteria bacterium]|nr:transcriptional repressor [Candidatus Paceibacterota bacterium]